MSPLDLSLLVFFASTLIKIAVDFRDFMREETVAVTRTPQVPARNTRPASYHKIPSGRKIPVRRTTPVPSGIKEERKRIAA